MPKPTPLGKVAANLAAGIVAVTLVLATAATPAHATSPFTCDYTFTPWSGGFSADLAIANSGPTIDGWTAHWTFATATLVTTVWSGQLTQANPNDAVATPLPWTRVIPSGGAVTFGWTAMATSTEVPDDITVNGQSC